MCPWPRGSSSLRRERRSATTCAAAGARRGVGLSSPTGCTESICFSHMTSRDPYLGPSPVKGNHSKLTQPHTPHLMTKKRSRPPTVKSSAELEAEEVEKLQK